MGESLPEQVWHTVTRLAVFWSSFTVYMIWVIAVANKAWIPEMEGALGKLLHPILAAYCIEPKHYNQQVSTGL